MRTACGVTAALLLLGCGGGPPREAEPPPSPVLDPVAVPEDPTPEPTPAEACEPAEGPLPSGASLASEPRTYRLVVVRGDVAERPSWAEGELRLVPRPADLRRLADWRTPLQGVAEIEIERVGALRVGSLTSEDPAAPGVLVLRSPDPEPELILRFGSAANRADRTAFDEAFTVLRVTRIDEGGFAGSWRSGRFGDEVAGYFCAWSVGGA